jgi:hypothetical protein
MEPPAFNNDFISEKKLKRYFRRIIVSIMLSISLNIIFFINAATPATYDTSVFERILKILTLPSEKFTDWIMPGHISWGQLIVVFAFSLFFYTIISFIILQLWDFMFKYKTKMHKH